MARWMKLRRVTTTKSTTNDAASAVTRLLDLGIEPYLVSSSVIGVLSQRLVRRICENCKTESTITNHGAFSDIGSVARSFVGNGCDLCRHSGYTGRVGIFELMVINNRIRKSIQQRSNASEVKEIALSSGMKLLRSDGIDKINSGQTTISEVDRVSMITVEGSE